MNHRGTETQRREGSEQNRQKRTGEGGAVACPPSLLSALSSLCLCASVVQLFLLAVPVRADDWPQWLGPQRDGVWRETGILSSFPKGGPAVRWRTPIGGGYAGPAVARGRVFVTDRQAAPGAKGKKKRTGKERVLCLD